VIAKRSRGANILQHDIAPFSGYDIRQWAEGMTWQRIRKVAIDRYYDEDEDDYFEFDDEEDKNDEDKDDYFNSSNKKHKNVEVDKYNNVDDYVWDDTVS
jgi:hypothetical protein